MITYIAKKIVSLSPRCCIFTYIGKLKVAKLMGNCSNTATKPISQQKNLLLLSKHTAAPFEQSEKVR